MSWSSAKIAVPQTWIDEAREQVRADGWFRDLTQFVCSKKWTHIHHQTHTRKIADPFESQKRYSRFLAEVPSSWGVKAVLWAVEQHPGGHGSHIHSLWNASYDERLKRLQRLSPSSGASIPPLFREVKSRSWASLGWSRLWPIAQSNSQVALRYCLKYIVKSMKRLRDATPLPKPWEPMERENLWGIWTSPASKC